MSRTVTVEDFAAIALVSDPQFEPNGRHVAFVHRRLDIEKGKTFSNIQVVGAGDGDPRQFTAAETSAWSPRWSPDGTRIAFLSDRQKPISQIFIIPSNGGEAQPLTKLDMEGGIHGFRWSPDGARIAFVHRAAAAEYTKEVVEQRKKDEKPSPPRVHTHLNYRTDGAGYVDGAYAQIWVLEVATGESRQLTAGDYDCGLPVWSPDSSTLAFLSDRRDDRDILAGDDCIHTIAVAGGELTRVLSPAGGKHGLAWSPDGATFAYVGGPEADDAWGTRNNRIMVIPAGGASAAQDLTGHSDLCVGYLTLSDAHDSGAGDIIQWNADGSALFFPVSALGDTRLTMVMASGGDLLPLSRAGHEMGGFSLTSDGRAALTLGSPVTPQEIHMLRHTPGGIDIEQLTHFNAAWLEIVRLSAPEAFAVPNGEGGNVCGWVVRPADFDCGSRYPMVLYVHGGPHAQYGNTLFHELQLLAARGYVVVYTNPRGSTGYGEEHTRAIRGNWGGPDFQDIMSAADYGAALPYVDSGRTSIMGGSYGGYMTAWAIGHTDRFACAIADRLVACLPSMAGTCDFTWRPDSYFKGSPWSDPAELWRCSPLAYAANIKTPLLLIHSDGDLRCPVSQAEELFAALRLQGKVVEFVRYPAETSHGMSRNGPPALRIDRLNRNVAWLDRWLCRD